MQMSMEDADPAQWVRPYDQASPAVHLSGLGGLKTAASGRTASSGLGGYFSPKVHSAEELQPTSESRRFRWGLSLPLQQRRGLPTCHWAAAVHGCLAQPRCCPSHLHFKTLCKCAAGFITVQCHQIHQLMEWQPA